MNKGVKILIKVLKYGSYVTIPLLSLHFVLQGFVDKIWDWEIVSDILPYIVFLFLISMLEELQRTIDKMED